MNLKRRMSLPTLLGSASFGILIAISITACGSSDTGDKTYESVEALKDAFVKAGGSCDSWNQDDQIDLALESGSCGSNTRLSIYESHLKALESVKATNLTVGGMIGYDALNDSLVGANWVINSDANFESIQESLGGQIKAPPPEPEATTEEPVDEDEALVEDAASFAAAIGPKIPSLGPATVGEIYSAGFGVCSALVGGDPQLAKDVLSSAFDSVQLSASEANDFLRYSVELLCPENSDALQQ